MRASLLTLALLTFPSPLVAQDASTPSYSAETYGDVSGDVLDRGLGLVLELVGGQTDSPRLRLFGGPAGEPAAILLSAASAERTGFWGATVLIGHEGARIEGAFDWTGSFEVPLTRTIPEGAILYAQGLHSSVFDLGPGGRPLVQLSNGISVFPTTDDDSSLWFDELLPHFPDDVDMLPPSTSLAERLQTYLNSTGDSVKIALRLEGNGGAGGYVGGANEMEVSIERTDVGAYEMRVGMDMALTAGVELAEGLEAGVEKGVGVSQVFRFHSAPGAARGLFGMLLSTVAGPGLPVGQLLEETGVLGDAETHIQRVKSAVEFAQRNADEAEAFLWDVLDVAAQNAAARRASARSAAISARRRLAAASWRQRPRRAVELAIANARFAAAHASSVAAWTARVRGEQVLELAKAKVEEHREELRAALAAVARAKNLIVAVAQLRGYTAQHFVGTEMRQKMQGSVELSIPIPVQLATLGAGIEREFSTTVSALFEQAEEEGRTRIVVTRDLENEDTASAAFVVGGEYQRVRSGEIVETIEFGNGDEITKTVTASVSKDVQTRGFVGRLVAIGMGFGRAWSVEFGASLTEDPNFDLTAMLLGEETVADHMEIGFELQDRRIRTIDCDLIISVAGCGGGFELDVEWADQGRQLTRSTTIGDALRGVFDAVDQIPDGDSNSVVLN